MDTSRTTMGICAGLLALSMIAGSPAAAQEIGGPGALEAWRSASHLVVPQASAFAWDRARTPIRIESVRAHVEIVAQTARTTLELALSNPAAQQAEAVLLLPVPAGAAVGGFDFEGSAAEPSAVLLPRDEARRTYDEIVRRVQDPGLLEFAGFNLIRSSLFPVPAFGRQRVRITYEHLLEADGNRVDYVLPRSESLANALPWQIEVDLRAEAPVSTVYSPTHELDVERVSPARLRVRVKEASVADPGPFLLSYLLEREGVSATLLAYPDPEVGGGYFLLMAGLPASISQAETRMRREVTVVLDRSGSMAGEKMDQARAAALQVVEGLDEGEAFNVIDYASQVSMFAPGPVVKDAATTLEARKYLASLRPAGGTNIHDALLEALRQPRREGLLPIVLFLTDGLPTVGDTSEVAIRAVVETANPSGRRIFTFGVGHDVNVPLLDRLSDATRATSTFVLPGEDVEVKVAKVFQRLYGPILSDLQLASVDGEGALTTRAVRELIPERLPDLFEGDQLVLLGQYVDGGPLRFRLTGNFLGRERTFAFEFGLARASTRNAFVPRLWATRRIAFLVDQIRQAGAALGGAPVTVGETILRDPRYRELADEILRLSTRFGVLSEYTAFLATEGTDLGNWETLQLACDENLDRRAVRTRSGEAAVNQGRNFNEQKLQAKLNYANSFWNESNALVEFGGVQQVVDRAFFKRGTQWIDAQLVTGQLPQVADEVVLFGSEQHRVMLDQLVSEGRQGLLALPGDILMRYEGRNVLVRNAVGAGN